MISLSQSFAVKAGFPYLPVEGVLCLEIIIALLAFEPRGGSGKYFCT